MPTLSFETVRVIALGKLLLGAGVMTLLIGIWRGWLRPGRLAFLASFLVTGFYAVLSTPLQRMWWGNNGDEVFIASFFTQVMKANPFQDFYYAHLPVFYPPLYFWVVGTSAKFFLENGVAAAKLGVVLVLMVWFVGAYALVRRSTARLEEETFARHSWMPVVFPIILLFLIDFNDIILKPYEAISAMGMLLWVGLMAEYLPREAWKKRTFVWFSFAGGVLFLTYYFWWFIIIPVLALLVFSSRTEWKTRLLRVSIVGGGIALLSLPYLAPLLWSYRKGIEHWQAQFFVPQDLSTFFPFFELNLRSALVLFGFAGLIWFRRDRFIQASLLVLIMSYVWQLFHIGRLAVGGAPLQAAKPFLFLGMSAIAIGATRLVLMLWDRVMTGRPMEQKKLVATTLLVLTLPLWPMSRFLDDPVVRAQIEKDRMAPGVASLIPIVTRFVPDYADRVWLTSGVPDLNIYLPMHYYLAHNPHFSHPAVRYSERREALGRLAEATPEAFVQGLNTTEVSALLLYRPKEGEMYPLFLWADRFPNGGGEERVDVPKASIEALGWEKRFENKEWVIYAK